MIQNLAIAKNVSEKKLHTLQEYSNLYNLHIGFINNI